MDSSGEADRAVQLVVSPGLLDGLLDSDLLELSQIRWDLGVEGFDTSPPLQTREESDKLLLLASQHYESDGGGAQPLKEFGVGNDAEIDDLFLAASQQFQSECTAHTVEKLSTPRRFGVPVSSVAVEQSRKSGIPSKTRSQTMWCCRVWGAWVKDRKLLPEADMEEVHHDLSEDVSKMSIESLQFWLPKFVLEVRRTDPAALSSRHIVCHLYWLAAKPEV